MATTDRFEIIAPLPSSAGFRRALAVDRGGSPRAVVLAFAPARVTDDPLRIAALVRDAEAAARVRHPNVVPVEGLETVGGAIAVVEPHRPGPSLRDLLDAGGRLPPDVAARIVADACAGLARVHALDPGDGRPLAHGSVAAERLVLGEDGATALGGLGAGLGEDPSADVRALAAVLHECLTGDPPASPPRPLDSPGVPPVLAAVVDLALGATGGQPLRSAAVLGEAIAAALPLAAREAVAAYVEAILPAGEGERAALARLVARVMGEEADLGVELLEEGTAPTPTPTSIGSPEAGHPEPFDSAASGRYAQDKLRDAATAPERSPGAPAAAPVLISTASAPPAATFTWTEAAPTRAFDPVYPAPVVIPARAAPASAPAPAPVPGAAVSPDSVSVFPAPAQAAPRRSRAPIVITAAACLVIGFGASYAATRGMLLPDLRREDVAVQAAPAQLPSAPPQAPAPAEAASARATEEPIPAAPAPVGSPPPTRPAKATGERKKPARRVAASSPSGTGFLVVTAPAEAEVLLDGTRVGKGDVRREIEVGAHRVEVRLGGASVTERFTLSRGETWTYDVTPTSN